MIRALLLASVLLMLSSCSRTQVDARPADAGQPHLSDKAVAISQALDSIAEQAGLMGKRIAEASAERPVDAAFDSFIAYLSQRLVAIEQWLKSASASAGQLGTIRGEYEKQIKDRDTRIAELEEQHRQDRNRDSRVLVAALRVLGVIGALVLAFGCAAPFLPIGTLAKWSFAAIVFGGVLAALGFFGAPMIASYTVVAPWVMYVIGACVCAVMLTIATLLIVRIIRAERATGNAAQDKLIANGKHLAAASAAWANRFIQTGDEGEAWNNAKIIEAQSPTSGLPT